MKNVVVYISFLILLLCVASLYPQIVDAAANRPFPQSINYPGTIKPNNVTQTQMNNSVQAFYTYWKNKYVQVSNGNTPGGGFFVKADSTGGHNYPIKSNSEAHGYGMIIFVLMGDQTYFDGMYNMYDKHRSTINNNNMSWVITVEELASQDSDSATDGDMDIAYALILAHQQWGSNGTIDYLTEAKRIITQGIKKSDMNITSLRTMLGDWDTNMYSTRSSDWMTDHMRAYYDVTKDNFWLDSANAVYSIIDTITLNHSSKTGLMPDFIINSTPQPANPYFLEGPNDGKYYYNACRYPWRITMDYAHYGTINAKLAVNKLVNWLKTATNNNPANIKAGYDLNGNVLSGSNYFTTAFAAPFITGCIVDSSHQQYLNAGWSKIISSKASYYEDSINLLCMLVISGNWWAPGNIPTPPEDTTPPSIPERIVFENITDTSVDIIWQPSTDNVRVMGYNIYLNGQLTADTTTNSVTLRNLVPQTLYSVTVQAYDTSNLVSGMSQSATFETLPPNPIPVDPNATGIPGNPSISKNKWNGESSYDITMNMWWGNNGTKIILYENDIAIEERILTPNTPSSQKVVFNLKNKPNNKYIYKCKLLNQHGSSMSSEVIVTVSQSR